MRENDSPCGAPRRSATSSRLLCSTRGASPQRRHNDWWEHRLGMEGRQATWPRRKRMLEGTERANYPQSTAFLVPFLHPDVPLSGRPHGSLVEPGTSGQPRCCPHPATSTSIHMLVLKRDAGRTRRSSGCAAGVELHSRAGHQAANSCHLHLPFPPCFHLFGLLLPPRPPTWLFLLSGGADATAARHRERPVYGGARPPPLRTPRCPVTLSPPPHPRGEVSSSDGRDRWPDRPPAAFPYRYEWL